MLHVRNSNLKAFQFDSFSSSACMLILIDVDTMKLIPLVSPGDYFLKVDAILKRQGKGTKFWESSEII